LKYDSGGNKRGEKIREIYPRKSIYNSIMGAKQSVPAAKEKSTQEPISFDGMH
jgi:hypothetical protein